MLSQNAPQTIYRKDYKPSPFMIDKVSMDFHIFDGETFLTTETKFRKNPDCKDDHTLTLTGHHFELLSIALDGEDMAPSDYHVDEKKGLLTIENFPERGTLVIETRLEPENNTALEGLYKSSTMYCTQCEAQGFRRMTYFLDRPDVMTRYRVRIEADKKRCPVLLSNGNKMDEGELNGGRHYTIWEDPFKKPSYLFALVAGDLGHIHDTFTTMTGKKVDLYIYTEHGFETQCGWAMESLKRSMKWDEEKYGREYDLNLFNIVAVSDFNMGAMENKSLNIFNTSAVLASAKTATDANFKRVEGVVAHEYFHNWTGNRITCRDWFQLTLKEGLTVFRDHSFSGDMHSKDVQRIEDVSHLRAYQFAEDSSPMAHPIRPDEYIEIDNFYTMTIYEKGAEVIRMLHTILGPEKWRKATDLYFNRHDGQAVTCDDFVKCMEEASGLDLSQFKLWYEQAGTPILRMTSDYDQQAQQFTLHFEQEVPPTPNQPEKKPMVIPVTCALIGPQGKEMPLDETGVTEKTFLVTEEKQSFVFENIPVAPVPSVLRSFSAPVKLETKLRDHDLRFLMVNDTDGFNRWDAGQTFMTRKMMEQIENRIIGQDITLDETVLDAFHATLHNKKADPHLKAVSLALPSQSVMEQKMVEIDPRAVFQTRKKVKKMLAEKLKDSLLKQYEELSAHGKKENSYPTSQEMAHRTLKNVCLSYLMALGESDIQDMAVRQYQQAANMTDKLSALSMLLDTERPERDNFLEDFYKAHADDPLVIDKWFAIQASSDRSDIYDTLSILFNHPAFTMKNPNRARAVYMTFALGNPYHFHDKSGHGYGILLDAIKELNTLNPHMASRFLMPFQNWKRYADPYKTNMQEALENLAKEDKLSPNVYEIVTKYLGK